MTKNLPALTEIDPVTQLAKNIEQFFRFYPVLHMPENPEEGLPFEEQDMYVTKVSVGNDGYFYPYDERLEDWVYAVVCK